MLRMMMATLGIAVALPLSAQSTGTPVYIAPTRAYETSEIGASLSFQGNTTAFEGAYREYFSSAIDAGVRGGFRSGGYPNGGAAVLLGGDMRVVIIRHNESVPIDASFTVGVGIETGQGSTVAYLPIGFSMGRRLTLQGSAIVLTPYVEPVLTGLFADASGTEFSVGVGLDARLTSRVDARFSAALGDRSGFGLSVAYLR